VINKVAEVLDGKYSEKIKAEAIELLGLVSCLGKETVIDELLSG
jgi:hypothetical protein